MSQLATSPQILRDGMLGLVVAWSTGESTPFSGGGYYPWSMLSATSSAGETWSGLQEYVYVSPINWVANIVLSANGSSTNGDNTQHVKIMQEPQDGSETPSTVWYEEDIVPGSPQTINNIPAGSTIYITLGSESGVASADGGLAGTYGVPAGNVFNMKSVVSCSITNYNNQSYL